MSNYNFLSQINFPSDLKKISESDLQKVADELREETISAVSETGGHLGASLGVVELTVALHYVFNTPKDKLIWDVGHQCYPHKIIRVEKIKLEPYDKVVVFLDLQKDQKVNMILLEQHIVQLLYRQL